MTPERRVLLDPGGALAPLVDGLHDIVAAFEGRRAYAVVGGVAVLTYVQGHRVTHDIDSAVRGLKPDIREDLMVVAEPPTAADADAQLANEVPVDLLVGSVTPPRRGSGRRREAKAHGIRWSIHTATKREVVCEPANTRGAVTAQFARASALIAMKTISMTDPKRGDKAASDRLDLWRLLSDAPARATGALEELAEAPEQLWGWTVDVLTRSLRDDPWAFITAMGDATSSAPSVADVRDIWEAVVEPHLPT